MSLLFVTGTNTGVGKTVATAALACHARLAGLDVAVAKPVQTGTEAGDDDLAEIARLAGVTALAGLARYGRPLAPAAAAALAGAALPSRAAVGEFLTALDRPGRLTLVEGAGGLLVELAAGGVTLRELAADLGAPVLVVTGAELGTLNHTALTLEALAVQNISCAGLVLGSWPAQPDTVAAGNREVLAGYAPLRAVLPAGAGRLAPAAFAALSAEAFDPAWPAGLVG